MESKSKFTKYNSIENISSKRLKDLEDQTDISKDKIWWVTEKVHGSNFSIWYNKETDKVFYGKRNSFLTEKEGKTFLNVQTIFPILEEKIRKLTSYIVDFNEIIVYGEIFGGSYEHPSVEVNKEAKRVQKGVEYTPNTEFIAFDLKIDGKYTNKVLEQELLMKSGFLYSEPLMEGTIDECKQFDVETFKTTIPSKLGLPEIENNFAEGVVITPITPLFDKRGSRWIFKKKRSNFSEVIGKKKQIYTVSSYPPEIEELKNDMLRYVTDQRLSNVLSKIQTGESIEKSDFGKVIGLFQKDVYEEYTRDESESFKNMENKSFKEYIKNAITKECRALVQKRI